MNDTWDLTPIYTGFDDPTLAADMAALKDTADKLNTFAASLPREDAREGLESGIALLETLETLVGKLYLYAELRQSACTTDTEAGSKIGQIMGIYSGVAAAEAGFRSWAAGLENLQTIVAESEYLQDYGFYFRNIAESSRYLLPGIGEAVAAKYAMSGGRAWAELHQYLTSTVAVHYRDTVTNLPGIRNMAYSDDAAVRKDAFEAELKCYESIKDSAAFALNSIKLETISDCQLRGYASPLERTLKHADMKRETLDAMLGAMDEYLPKFWQYLKAKAKLLGHEGGLPWYDLFAPVGESSTQFTTAQTRDYLVNTFRGFDTELADMVAEAFDNAWIDFYPREGKTGGAFCAGAECIGQSRILTNFGGTMSDVVTLAHELGHAFHDHCIHSHRPLNHNYSMPLAETASTFNECVVMNAAIRDAADDSERMALIESQLRDATQIICDIYSRYRFESMVFAHREQEFMDAETLSGFMLEAQRQSYGDGLDHNVLHKYMWVCKGHYYGPTFYNFPYAFGGLFARGLYAQYEQEGAAFVPKYKQLLYTTTIATAEDTAKVADIDLTDKDFWRRALQTIAYKIDLFCELAEKLA